jgi:hypothetical protein
VIAALAVSIGWESPAYPDRGFLRMKFAMRRSLTTLALSALLDCAPDLVEGW